MSVTDIRNFLFESLTTIKARLSEFNDLVWKQNQMIAITKNGKPHTVLVKFETFKKLIEAYEESQKDLYFDPKRLRRKKRDPEKEKWLQKFQQQGVCVGFYEKKQ